MTFHNLLMVGNFPSGTGYAWKMIGSCFRALGQDFVKNGHGAIVCFPEVNSMPDYLKNSGIDVLEFDFYRSSPLSLIRFLKKNNVDLVYLIDYPTFSLKFALLKIFGVKKIVVHDHGSGGIIDQGHLKRKIKTTLNKINLITADKVFVISKFVKSRVIKSSCFPESKIITILNGVNLSDYEIDKKIDVHLNYKIENNKKIIFCAARANFYKGIHVFIEAARILRYERKRKDLFFLYCGDGPDLLKFQNMVSEYHLDECFFCTGNVVDINKILLGVDCCVVPSSWEEGFGMIVIEAMAACVPVIATKVGGIVEIIEDYFDGIYVEPENYIDIADAVERLIDDSDLHKRIRQNGMNKVRTVFDRNIQHQKIIKNFRDLCGT